MSLMLKSAPSVRLQTPPVPKPTITDKEYQEMIDLFDQTLELLMEESGELKSLVKEFQPIKKQLDPIKE
mgnify:CR=1 FL=1|jgi:hypothetical protein